jgi:hypothetical protein
MAAPALQKGAAMMEFALSVSIFFVALIAVMELSRFMLLWNTAAEATARASRLASLCDPGAPEATHIREQVRYFVEASGQIKVGSRNDWLVLSYWPANCSQADCTLVQARLSGLQASLLIPGLALTLPLPAHSSTRPREAMSNVIAGEANNVCN